MMAGLILFPPSETFPYYNNPTHQTPTLVIETISTKSEHSSPASAEAALLARYQILSPNSTPDTPLPATTRDTGSRVLILRLPSTSPLLSPTRHAISLLFPHPHPIISPIHEWLSTPSLLYIITSDVPRRSLSSLIFESGPIPEDGLKDVATQLFDGLAHLFLHHIAPLRVTPGNMWFDRESGLVLSGWEDVVEVPWRGEGEQRVPGEPYAMVEGREDGERDIYTAPEACVEGEVFNARKAVVWSCGVVLYYMSTGQTKRLASLNHPSSSSDTNTRPPSRRHSIPNRVSKDLDLPKIIHYPSRYRVPSWAINIISRMLLFTPTKRPELIEVAAKVPKLFGVRGQRPLMEAAYLDWKRNVGPAGGTNTWENGQGWRGEHGDGLESSSSSVFGGAGGSVFSVSSVAGFLGGVGRRASRGRWG